MLLLAVADILFVTTPWLMFALHSFGESWGSFCDVKCLWGIYEYASTITITQNRWMTFFMAFKRFLCVFVFTYSLYLGRKSKQEYFRDNILWGFSFGLVQGIAISTFMIVGDRRGLTQEARYGVYNVHPILITALMAIITILMIIRLTFCRSFLFPIRENKISAQFRRGIISVAIIYILAQSATIVYFYDRKRKLDDK